MPTPIGRLWTEMAAQAPERPAITCGARTVTRDQLERRANRLARAYEALGVTEGDFVTIGLPNGIEFIEAAFAVWKLGAVPAPVSSVLPAKEREAIIALTSPSLVLGFGPDVSDGSGQPVLLPAGYEPPGDLSDAPIEPDRIPPAWKAPASGGSTGRPKLIVSGAPGVMESNAGAAMGMRVGGVELVPGPMYHNAPFSMAFAGLFTDNHVVILERFDAVAALEAIERYRVDWVLLVPTMMLRMHRAMEAEPGRFDISSLQAVWHGAAPCPTWLKACWIERIGGDHLFELYGGTEGQAMTVINGTEWLEHRGSVGRPMFGEMRIEGTEGEVLPAGEVGEIFMRGPEGAPPSYRYVGAEARERGGWESLGDLGWMDEDGYLYVSDRRTDMILSGGSNVYPAEVEAALLEHPAVESAVVVGLPDEDLGQRVHALVHATGGLTDDDLRAFLADRLVRYKVPRSFRFVDQDLRDDAGKVRRSALRDQEAALLGSGPATER
jgi:bile acid-coenzyme A ligase